MHHTNRSKFTLPPPHHPISLLRDRWRGTERHHRRPFRVASMSHPRKIAVLSLSLSQFPLSPVLARSLCVGDLVTSSNDIAHSFNCVYREQYSSLIWCNTLRVKRRYTSSSPPAGMCRYLKSLRLSRKQVQQDLYSFPPLQCRLGTHLDHTCITYGVPKQFSYKEICIIRTRLSV